MTRVRPEDVLREMRTAVVPVDDADAVDARRRQTVARLRELQVSAGTRREVEVSYRKRLLIAAAILLSSAAALAAAIETRGGALPPKAPSHEAMRATERFAVASVPSAASAPRAQDSAGVVTVPAEPEPEQPSTPSRASKPRDKAPAKSTLAAENALMQSALSAGRNGDDARCAALLDTLLGRYPESPLAQNAEVERFRALERLGDLSKASEEARRYLGEHPEGMAQDEARRLAVEPPSSLRTGSGLR